MSRDKSKRAVFHFRDDKEITGEETDTDPVHAFRSAHPSLDSEKTLAGLPDIRSAIRNTNYRKVIKTIPGELQIVLMHIEPGDKIPIEIHDDATQLIICVSGSMVTYVGGFGAKYGFSGDYVTVPKNVPHEIANYSETEPLKLFTIYTPPHHPPDLIQKTRPETY